MVRKEKIKNAGQKATGTLGKNKLLFFIGNHGNTCYNLLNEAIPIQSLYDQKQRLISE